jgi:hypothetical protein
MEAAKPLECASLLALWLGIRDEYGRGKTRQRQRSRLLGDDVEMRFGMLVLFEKDLFQHRQLRGHTQLLENSAGADISTLTKHAAQLGSKELNSIFFIVPAKGFRHFRLHRTRDGYLPSPSVRTILDHSELKFRPQFCHFFIKDSEDLPQDLSICNTPL